MTTEIAMDAKFAGRYKAALNILKTAEDFPELVDEKQKANAQTVVNASIELLPQVGADVISKMDETMQRAVGVLQAFPPTAATELANELWTPMTERVSGSVYVNEDNQTRLTLDIVGTWRDKSLQAVRPMRADGLPLFARPYFTKGS